MACPGCGSQHEPTQRVVAGVRFFNCTQCDFSTWDDDFDWVLEAAHDSTGGGEITLAIDGAIMGPPPTTQLSVWRALRSCVALSIRRAKGRNDGEH